MGSSSGLLPFEPDVDSAGRGAETMSLAEAGDAVTVLSSTTARAVLASLYDDPAPASGIAERLQLTIQNATYHLSRLQAVGLVTVVGTWYSSKGKEMKVYAPTMDPLVLVAGRPSDVRSVADLVDDAGPGVAGEP